ncbi:MAG: sugar phosphate isomerase/epimerase family protein [candidate division KSB1 bacterium]|jgi:sugar phosphate isomerase/epimerase|nr:sugar phosphate isomerase/epimerase family protein [candidate division KSB1 bacterium]
MKLAIVSDEISYDFREAINYGKKWGLHYFELRNLITGRVPYIARDEIDQIFDVKSEFGITISSISPGLFEISLQQEEQLKKELEEKIYDSFRFAAMLGTRDIIISGFKRYDGEPQHNFSQILHILQRMAVLAEKYGFKLLIENHADSWCDTAENMTKVLESIDSKALRAYWNPGNSFAAGEIPYPYGYLTVRKHIYSLHVKDARRMDSVTKWVPIGQGEVDWEGQFHAIMHGVDLKYITIQAQNGPFVEASKYNVEQVLDLLKDYKLSDEQIIR